MIATAINTRVFCEGEDLATFIIEYVPGLHDHSILVVTSKIVALAERRTVPLTDDVGFEALVRSESEFAMATEHVWLTVKEGVVMASAGIDRSNAANRLILLPKDSNTAAYELRRRLMEQFNLKTLGVLITDSRILPLRAGVTGVALGYAGFRGIRDYRGKPDIFGRPMEFSMTNIADSLATTAVLLMGEAAEQQPIAHIENAPVEFCNTVNRNELCVDINDDVYRPLFNALSDVNA